MKKSAPTAKPAGPRGSDFLLLGILCFVVYGSSMWGEFVWDDTVQIVRNESIRSIDNIPNHFTTPLWSFAGTINRAGNQYYRPLQTTIFTLVYQWRGLSPFPFHVVDVLLHVLTTSVVLLLLFEIGLSRSVALSASVLFAVHPVHTEAVAWIAATGELACALFYFTALWMFLRYAKGRTALWMVLSMASFLLALFAKEMAVTLPAAAVVILRMKQKDLELSLKKTAWLIAPFFVVLLFYGALRMNALGLNMAASFDEHATIMDWITLELWTVGRYMRYVLVPFPLAAFHIAPLYLTDRILSTIIYALVIAAVGVAVWMLRKAIPAGFWWAILFPVLLAPALYLKAIVGGFLFAERYLYIPSFAGVALLALVVAQLPRKFAIGAIAGLTLVFSVATVLQSRTWRTDEDLYTHSVRWFPENLDGWLQLAQVQMNKGNYTQAQRAYEMAEKYVDDDRHIKRGDDHYRLQLGLGTLAARRNDSATAKKYLLEAIDLHPTGENAYTILAGVLTNLDKNFEAAIPVLEKAMALDPVDDQARDSMGVALYNLHRYEESVPYFQEALRINPQSPLASQHLEHVLRRLGRR